MKSDSIRLAWAGALIGVLAVSAVMAARANPSAAKAGPAAAVIATLPVGAAEAGSPRPGDPAGGFGADPDAVPVMAEQTEAPVFRLALRVEGAIPGEQLFLCDAFGNPLEEIRPDDEGDAGLGPFPPGPYSVWRGAEELGRFRLLENAALAEASGLLRTDGELLYLERALKK